MYLVLNLHFDVVDCVAGPSPKAQQRKISQSNKQEQDAMNHNYHNQKTTHKLFRRADKLASMNSTVGHVIILTS